MEKRKLWEISKWCLLIALVLCFNLFVARLAIVYGPSMEPTLRQYDFLLVWQLGYEPKTGDIIVTTADNELHQSIIKRVAAVAGETYLYDRQGERIACTVPRGQVFLVGDNEDFSVDSRELGCFEVGDIRGKVIMRLFPFNRITVYD